MVKKGNRTRKTKQNQPKRASGRSRRPLFHSWGYQLQDWHLVLIVFILALAVRLLYLINLQAAPFFHHPVGYFHSSPFYPYFIGLIYKLAGVHFTLLRVVQFLIGSLNCGLIYMLTRKLTGGGQGTALMAGLMAASYGVFVFFDGDLLMIPLVLCFTLLFLLLLVKAAAAAVGPAADSSPSGDASPGGGSGDHTHPGEEGSPDKASSGFAIGRARLYFFMAGICLGLAGLGKPNVLLFAPFALLWIFSCFTKSIVWRRWPAGLLFTLGCCLAVLPITLRNYAVSNDFVLVSSNAGVNLYIGNNEAATGVFFLPPESGLENSHLYLSSRAVAAGAMGVETLKPSQVSRYWTGEATRFMKDRPGRAVGLMARKFLLFWNHFEIPNHHNFYYIRLHYGDIFKLLLAGFSLVAPLAIIGILGLVRRRALLPAGRLYLGFGLVYMLSLIPFFITARYRLPAVPILVIFAALGVKEIILLIGARQFKWLGITAGSGLLVLALTRLPIVDFDFGFTHTVMGTVYSDLATEEPEKGSAHISAAIVEYKKALELRPLSVDAYYNLGIAYQRIGYFSGAVKMLESAVGLKPNHLYAGKALGECRTFLAGVGDRIPQEAVPRSPFEQALEQTQRGNLMGARALYEKVIRQDPHHADAYSQLGALSFDRQDYRTAIEIFKKGLKRKPDHFVLNNNIAGAYYRLGDLGKARAHWKKCLEVRPGDEGVLKQLRMVGE
jgi:4-amino-4-deoxy-L-arabinose transferase-like glycosyltransferase/Tfp pilus assembly protein PilF